MRGERPERAGSLALDGAAEAAGLDVFRPVVMTGHDEPRVELGHDEPRVGVPEDGADEPRAGNVAEESLDAGAGAEVVFDFFVGHKYIVPSGETPRK